MQNYQTPNGVPNGVISPENYYAATDIIKVSYVLLRSEVQNSILYAEHIMLAITHEGIYYTFSNMFRRFVPLWN